MDKATFRKQQCLCHCVLLVNLASEALFSRSRYVPHLGDQDLTLAARPYRLLSAMMFTGNVVWVTTVAVVLLFLAGRLMLACTALCAKAYRCVTLPQLAYLTSAGTNAARVFDQSPARSLLDVSLSKDLSTSKALQCGTQATCNEFSYTVGRYYCVDLGEMPLAGQCVTLATSLGTFPLLLVCTTAHLSSCAVYAQQLQCCIGSAVEETVAGNLSFIHDISQLWPRQSPQHASTLKSSSC